MQVHTHRQGGAPICPTSILPATYGATVSRHSRPGLSLAFARTQPGIASPCYAVAGHGERQTGVRASDARRTCPAAWLINMRPPSDDR